MTCSLGVLQAYVALAAATDKMPCFEAAHQRACHLYEEALSEWASQPWPMAFG